MVRYVEAGIHRRQARLSEKVDVRPGKEPRQAQGPVQARHRGVGRSRWITGDAARAHAHLERARHDAILVGGGTLRADAPQLDVRLAGLEHRSPRRLLLSRGAAPAGWEAIAAPEDINTLDRVDHLLIEGGAGAAAAFLRADLVDRLLLYRAPVLIGDGLAGIGDIGLTQLDAAHGRWRLTESRRLGADGLEVYARIRDA